MIVTLVCVPDAPDCMTLAELAEVLHPRVTRGQLELLVRAVGIEPGCVRHDGRNGRPPRAYPIATIMRLHSAVAEFLVAGGGEALRGGLALSGIGG